MAKSRRRLWLIVLLVGFAAALPPYPGSSPAPATASTRPAAAPQPEVRTSSYSSETPAGAYGSAGYGSGGAHKGGY